MVVLAKVLWCVGILSQKRLVAAFMRCASDEDICSINEQLRITKMRRNTNLLH
jgi:hypothetical protein